MDPRRAEENLELIRTLMERATRYEYLSARAGMLAGGATLLGSLSFLWLHPTDPLAFGLVWTAVLAVSLAGTLLENMRELRAAGEPPWSRPFREVCRSLAPAMFAAVVLTVDFFMHGRHLELPGLWMLCYGCGALATTTYAPETVRPLGLSFLALGTLTLCLGPTWSIVMMGVAFGGGHIVMSLTLLKDQRRVAGQPHLVRV
jgi:hypothetical protein